MVKHMKWWGWGEEHVVFDHRDKPALAPFVRQAIGIELDARPSPVIDFADLRIPPPTLPDELGAALTAALGDAAVTTDPLERVVHAYGKSLRDLVRIRAGDLGRLPDVVVYPGSEREAEAVVAAALRADAVVIAFGGGTNIAGSLEARRDEARTVISVDLGRLNQVLSVDADSQLARIGAGALGPDLEAQLNAQGWTLGHFPDSFTHSTLGGWIATRSSGMQSDRYGDIADITRAVRVVTPAGILATRPVPASSTGPSVLQMVLGSEGRVGLITEATVQVHPVPDRREILGYFFPSWDAAVATMRDLARAEVPPLVARVSDPPETAFSLATRKGGRSPLAMAQSAAVRAYLRRVKGFDLERLCLAFIGFEGSQEQVKAQRRAVGRLVGEHGGVCVGAGPGRLYDQKKFDTPYIRDFLLDRGALADVSETSAPWSQLLPLYHGVGHAAEGAFSQLGVKGWLMCHLAHTYRAGACLYFTFAFRPSPGAPPLDQYDVVKGAVQQAFIDYGGTLSHHHAVGVEHARWLADDVSPAGAAMVAALLDGIDPGHNLNPGKIIPVPGSGRGVA